jgi:predicted acylesterase/phospholipase RssA
MGGSFFAILPELRRPRQQPMGSLADFQTGGWQVSKRGKSLFYIVSRVFVGLPLAFVIPFVVLVAVWTLSLRPTLSVLSLDWLATEPQKMNLVGAPDAGNPNVTKGFSEYLLQDIFSKWNILHAFIALIIVLVYIGVIVVVIYNVCVGVNYLAARWKLRRLSSLAVQPFTPEPNPGLDNPLRGKTIGIVLAGGGAKGAFQAGAMKAIYRYLADRDALKDVKVIAGTSIGSWNALFWLADLIEARPPNTQASPLKNWWGSISLRSLVAPAWYLPGFRNAFFDTAAWKQSFDALFKEQCEIRDRLLGSKIRYYLTRHQVDTGTLACTTNSPDAKKLIESITERVTPTELTPPVKPEEKDFAGDADRFSSAKQEYEKAAGAFMEKLKTAVFASMDLPPLFPYVKIGRDLFEDGGVIDNLPIMFAAMEGCDFLFVLPLNADFNAKPDQRSIIRRLARIMDVRQGALERNSLKGIYLYNELAALREHVKTLKNTAAKSKGPQSETLQRALKRTHKEMRILAVCPQRTFVEDTIDTQEFWKRYKAAYVFDIMEEASTELLDSKDDLTRQKRRLSSLKLTKTKTGYLTAIFDLITHTGGLN